MMGWLIALAVLAVVFCTPLGASIRYDEDGMKLKILAGWIPISLPKKKEKANAPKKGKKEKKPKKPKEKKAKQTAKKPKEAPKKQGGKLTDFLPFVSIALDLLGGLRRKLRLRRLEMKLVLAGDDPCDLAVNYGRAWVALGNLIPLLERIFVIKKREMEVECDFEASETRITARLDITITLGGVLKVVIYHGVRALIAYLNLKKSRKGGASK